MPTRPRSPAARTPQSVRRARTRTLLLDATIECLAERGYAHTTTTEICQRAGVSRGAQLHHFPTKAELVAAAVEHAFEGRMEQLREAIAEVPEGTDRIQFGIDAVWSMFQGPACDAYLELALAARTDGELRPFVRAVSERHREAVEGIFLAMAPDRDPTNPFFDVGAKFLLALFDGLVLHRATGYDDAPGRAEAVVAAAKALAAMAFPTEGRR